MYPLFKCGVERYARIGERAVELKVNEFIVVVQYVDFDQFSQVYLSS